MNWLALGTIGLPLNVVALMRPVYVVSVSVNEFGTGVVISTSARSVMSWPVDESRSSTLMVAGLYILTVTFQVWDAVTGSLQWQFRGRSGEPILAAFSPDGSLLAVADWHQRFGLHRDADGWLLREWLPNATAVTHGTLAQLTLATFAWIAYQMTDRYRATRPVEGVAPGSGRKLVIFALVILVVQTVIGAIARHSNSPHALWTHVCNAFFVFFAATIATAYANGKLGSTPGIRGIARWTVIVMIVQLALGFVALAIRNAAGKTEENVANLGTALVISVHVLLGAALTVLIATLAAHVFRATLPASTPRPAPRSAGAAP